MSIFLSLILIVALVFIIVKNVISVVEKVRERKLNKTFTGSPPAVNKHKQLETDINDIQDVDLK